MKLHRMVLLEDPLQPEDDAYTMVVRFEGEGLIIGNLSTVGLTKDFRYKIRPENETVSVLDWNLQPR